jgi:hypothetical protein
VNLTWFVVFRSGYLITRGISLVNFPSEEAVPLGLLLTCGVLGNYGVVIAMLAVYAMYVLSFFLSFFLFHSPFFLLTQNQ